MNEQCVKLESNRIGTDHHENHHVPKPNECENLDKFNDYQKRKRKKNNKLVVRRDSKVKHIVLCNDVNHDDEVLLLFENHRVLL